MTFRDIALKNFKSQIKRYFSYFLCNSFSIMIFFMFSTLLFNDQLKSKSDADMTSMIFNIGVVAVALFSVFFINYAHSAFIQSRHKEFGVYMTLGMRSSDIRRMILMENVLIIFASFGAGLISGLVFSRIFQMIVLKLLNLDGIRYSLSFSSFWVTIVVFTAIFGSVIVMSSLAMRKLDISELLKKARQGDDGQGYGIRTGLAGLLVLLCSFLLLYSITHEKQLKNNGPAILLYFLISFTGVYLIIACLGKTLHQLTKKSKRLYYPNILVTTEIHHKFKQHRKIFFILSVLSSMIVFLVASSFSLFSLSKSLSEMTQPHHLEYAELGEINKISSGVFEDILRHTGTPALQQSSLEFLSLPLEGYSNQTGLPGYKPVVSESAFEAATHEKLEIPTGQVYNIITTWEPGYHGIAPSDTLHLQAGTQTLAFTVKDSVHMSWVTGASVYPSNSGMVVSDQDYTRLKAMIPAGNIGHYRIAEFQDWEKSGDAIQALKAALQKGNSLLSSSQAKTSISRYLKVASRIDTYESLKKGYSLFIFITTSMGILFFIAAGSVLYFKQYTEISSTRARFYKLYKLGITEKEARRMISRELKFTFFTPLFFGSLLGYSFIYFMTYWLGGEKVIDDFLLNATVVVAAYFLFQALFYLVTKQKYTSEILENL